MRWKFPDPLDQGEAKARAQTLQRIDHWWKALASRAPDITQLFSRKQDWDLAAWMGENLEAIHPDLKWEFGPGLKSGQRLVITPEFDHQLRPLVDVILQRAPEISCWEFYPYRIPESLEDALKTVAGRVGGDIAGSHFSAALGERSKIDLKFHPADASLGKKQLLNQAFVAAETLLGEEVL